MLILGVWNLDSKYKHQYKFIKIFSLWRYCRLRRTSNLKIVERHQIHFIKLQNGSGKNIFKRLKDLHAASPKRDHLLWRCRIFNICKKNPFEMTAKPAGLGSRLIFFWPWLLVFYSSCSGSGSSFFQAAPSPHFFSSGSGSGFSGFFSGFGSSNNFYQCFGSGSGWIRIIRPDPDPFQETLIWIRVAKNPVHL